MKKILLLLTVLLATVVAEAKVIKITFEDGTTKYYSSSQLSSIEFDDEGYVTIYTWDKQQEELDIHAKYEEVTIDDNPVIYEVVDATVGLTLSEGAFVPEEYLPTRDVTVMNILYPSTDPDANPVTLSGSIFIPKNIMDGEAESQGILLHNHFTSAYKYQCSTHGYYQFEGMLLAMPVFIDYIVVTSDFYGFGTTERFPQAFLCGTTNAKASLDCLRAAKQLLAEEDIAYGDLLFNIGYSSGGFDALAVQKLRDNEYREEFFFDKTFAGGFPADLKMAYQEYITTFHTIYNVVMPLMVVSFNESLHLNLSYSDVFQSFLADNIDDWILSKNYSTQEINDLIDREKTVDDIFQPPYLDLSSEESIALQDCLESQNLATGWTPDPTQKLYIMHARDDDYVPIQSARVIIPFLENNGYQASIIPGRTNLQTNFLVQRQGHLTATLFYLVQTVAALKAWPTMYENHELNPIFQQLLQSEGYNVIAMITLLENMGIDVRGIVSRILAQITSGQTGQSIDLGVVAQQFVAALALIGIDWQELNEMLADSGIDLQALVLQLIDYLMTPTDDVAAPMYAPQQPMVLPSDAYEQQLFQWLDAKMPAYGR